MISGWASENVTAVAFLVTGDTGIMSLFTDT
jgi:hypothetical protein